MGLEIKILAHHPLVRPEPEKMVIVWTWGTPSQPGCWDGEKWLDANGFEFPNEVTQWAEFPCTAWYTAPLPDEFKPKPQHRLLIVACSAKKNDAPGEIPARDRYTGAYYQIIKKYQGKLPETIILSAEFGFISWDQKIPNYDRLMDKARAEELKLNTQHQLEALLREGCYDEVFIAAGQHYRSVINPVFCRLERSGIVRVKHTRTARGGIGEQRSQLKKWLESIEK